MKNIHNKLVRDKIPGNLEKKKLRHKTHRVVSQKQHYDYLLKKLDEEFSEFKEKPGQEELVDILEVVYGLAANLGIERETLEKARKKKAEEKGEFREGIILEWVEEEKGGKKKKAA